jgi:hypothetical protein
MKKAFYVLFASASLSFVACKSGGDKTEAVDSTEMNNMANEAQEQVQQMDTAPAMPADTTKVDTAKHM